MEVKVKESTRWFGWTILMLPLHMGEQLLFGIGELTTLKHIIAGFLGLFHQPDYGIVVLVTAVATLVCGVTFGILLGGLAQEVSLSFWALVAIGEIHHLIETIGAGHYTPGTITAIPYVVFGVLMMRAIVKGHRARVRSSPLNYSQAHS
jgi:hypothetical protein